MKRSGKRIMAAAMALAMTMSLAACGSGGNDSGSGNEKERVELTGMVQQSRWYSGLQAMVEKLEEDENISIEFEVIPDDQYDNLMKMRLNSHEAPDLVVYQFADLFAAVDPEEFFVALDDESWMDKVIAPEITEYNGKHYGYCFESSNGFQGMIYNKDVFEKEGITELPQTLEEFYALCDKLKADGITPIAIPSDTWVPQIWMTSGMSRALGTEEACEDFANKILTHQAEFNDYGDGGSN